MNVKTNTQKNSFRDLVVDDIVEFTYFDGVLDSNDEPDLMSIFSRVIRVEPDVCIITDFLVMGGQTDLETEYNILDDTDSNVFVQFIANVPSALNVLKSLYPEKLV